MSHSLGFRPDLVINTTSAGVLNQGLELPTNLFFDDTHTYDLSYSIEDTPFLKLAKNLGAKLRYDGLGMLIEQAALSFEIWTKQKPQTNLNKVDIL
jgi:shikimate dehydrogenase